MPIRGIAIGIYGLTQELNLGVADVGEFAYFPQDRIAGAAAFGPARIGHHAIRASLVAALDDGEIGAEGMIAPRQFSFECLVGVGVKAGDSVLSGFQARQQRRKLPITGRAAHQAYPGGALENLLAFLLRHATEHADHFAGFAAKIISRIEFAEARKNFLRSFFANAAGIVEDEASFVRRGHLAISAPQEHAGHLLGIVLVHLAAECLDVEGAAAMRVDRAGYGAIFPGRCAEKGSERNVDRFDHTASMLSRPLTAFAAAASGLTIFFHAC